VLWSILDSGHRHYVMAENERNLTLKEIDDMVSRPQTTVKRRLIKYSKDLLYADKKMLDISLAAEIEAEELFG
jgi:hypothetical protein